MNDQKRILLAGIGQSLRGDDAAGLAAVRYWQEHFPETASHPRLRVEYLETPGLNLLELLQAAHSAILVDAMQGGGAPWRKLTGQELVSFTPDSRSAHGWGVAETLQLGYQLYPTLQEMHLVLIGIEGYDFTLGRPLSPQTQATLPAVARLIQEEVLLLLSG